MVTRAKDGRNEKDSVNLGVNRESRRKYNETSFAPKRNLGLRMLVDLRWKNRGLAHSLSWLRTVLASLYFNLGYFN